MPIELYHVANCPCCEKVRLALAIERLAYVSHSVDPGSARSGGSRPWDGRHPVLVDDEQRVVAEANHILRWLAGQRATLLPPGRRDQALSWVLVERADAVLAPLCRGLATGTGVQGKPLSEDDRKVLERRLADELAVLEGLLERGAFLFGERATVADVAAFAFLGMLPGFGERFAIDFIRVTGWFARLGAAASRPAAAQARSAAP